MTTSWDDGHRCDLRLATLLSEHGISGTFYVSPYSREFRRQDLLTEPEICEISKSFEVGSHTLTHPVLPEISVEKATEEISASKALLEGITGKSVTSFCYPRGAYEPVHLEIVRNSGYLFARTVTRYEFQVDSPYEAPTSIHAYNHWSDLWKMAKFSRFRVPEFFRCCQWDRLSNAMFDHVMDVGGIFHLWGHSWEIEAHDDWRRLERALEYISGREGVSYVTNGELLSSMTQANSAPNSS